MKATLFAFALVITLSLSATAQQQHKKPPVAQTQTGHPSLKTQEPKGTPTAVPPPSCNPCLFYGGDLNVSDSNAAGLSDENTLLISGSQTYAAVNIPAGANASVTGILFNVQASTAFDPFTATYDIRQGVSEGNGGTSVASGSGTIAVAQTGRNFIGLNEYTVTVTFPTVTLVPGEYWFNVEPACTNTLDGSCSVFRMFASNTTQETNAVNGSWQANNEMFLNSSFFGFTWANWCDSSLGLNTQQCADLSFGLVGVN